MTVETKSGLRMKADKMSGTSKEMKTDSEAYEQKAKIPDFIGQTCLSILVFIMGASMRADWVLFWAWHKKAKSINNLDIENSTTDGNNYSSPDLLDPENYLNEKADTDLPWNVQILNFCETRFAGFFEIGIPAFLVSYIFFFGIGGFLHFYYYVNQKDRASEWKCQPNHWLSTSLLTHEIVVGWFALNMGSFISTAMACWVKNDGWSMVYYDPKEYGLAWLFLQVPVTFIWQDYWTYWTHRILHWPIFYKNVHKLHHTYKQPTAFSVTALHPIELVWIYSVYMSPLFLFPVHYVPFGFIMMYTYYHGIIDHSGITFKHYWWQPWQPDCIFHDNHHQYFHVNFGFNIKYWDELHGTARQKDRIYREDIYYGQGKALADATQTEIQDDIGERRDENPLAYDDNKLVFDLTESDLKKIR